LRRLAVAMAVVSAAGCREELGPVSFATTRVTGVVREGGRPLGGGWIEFMPVDGTVGNLRSAPIGRDGRFEATKVAVGRHLVGFVAAPIGRPDVRQRFEGPNSPIRLAIPPGRATNLDIDLLEETLRHQLAPRSPANPEERETSS
jgi:hypothetical protein